MTKPNGASPENGGRAAAFFGGLAVVVKDLWLTLDDIARQLARPSGRAAWAVDLRMARAVLRWALPWAVLGRVSPNASPVRWLELSARRRANDCALSDQTQRLTFVELLGATRRVAEFLDRSGVQRGHRVAILMSTNAQSVIALLGCWYLGAIPCPIALDTPESLLNDILTRLKPDCVLRDSDAFASAFAQVDQRPVCDESRTSRQMDLAEAVAIPAGALAMILATSGTEGRAKLCRLTAGRLALSGHALGGLALDCRRGDVIYCPLPIQHATGITLGLMPALVHGVALHLGGKFSASRFWSEICKAGATQIIYVGDLWRYVLAAKSQADVPKHRVRVTVGNGLDPSTWQSVVERSGIPRVLEFYGATEAPSALLNFSGRIGSIGRVPMRRLSRYVVVREERSDQDPIASWKKCVYDEPGELWIRVPRGRRPWLGGFEGYIDRNEDVRVLVQSAFVSGDCYYRTGDWVRCDSDDFFYFLDRLGDVWRSKGHNVSTIWLANFLRQVQGIDDVCVIQVALDDSARRFGLVAAIAPQADGVAALEARLRELPNYARPQLLQCVSELRSTSTFKPQKSEWRAAPWSPTTATGNCYLWDDGLRPILPEHWLKHRAKLLQS